MSSHVVCTACGRAIAPSANNDARQAFCSRPPCQRIRRSEAQCLRRARAKKDATLTRHLKPADADWLRKHPLIVGLISMLIGSGDRNQIEACCAALIERGQKILDGTLFEDPQNNPNINELGNQKRY